MSESQSNHTQGQGQQFTAEQMQSAMFQQLVMQQASMAMMMLGHMPHPESGETVKDLEGAQFFIDTLEMLEAKTKGNLTAQESGLLKKHLMQLRLAFVQAAEEPATANKQEQPADAKTSAPAQPASPAVPGSAGSDSSGGASQVKTGGEEHRPKFSKKY